MNAVASEELNAFYGRAAQAGLSPLWEVLAQLAPPAPQPRAVPCLWRYAEVRSLLFEVGGLISPEDAERRVLILENPGFRNGHRITDSMYAGLQLILPGEVAPAHRHVANALRFIVEGRGAFTTVNGERTSMHPGDFVITPGWTWHDHGNETQEPMVWMDGLDIHIVNLLSAGFGEGYPEQRFPDARPEGMSQVEWGYNLRPIGPTGSGLSSPLFNYPYERTREVLDTLSRQAPLDPWHGMRVMYTSPLTGGWAIPTIAAWMQLLPRGLGTMPYRSTDGTVFCVVEGEGRSVIDGQTFEWGPSDIFAVPSWKTVEHHATSDAVLFGYSDRATQERLGVWREQRIER